MLTADPAAAHNCVADEERYPGMANGDCPDGTGNPFAALTAVPPRYTGPPEVLEMMTVQGPAGTAAIFVAAVPTAHCPASIATAQTAPAETVT